MMQTQYWIQYTAGDFAGENVTESMFYAMMRSGAINDETCQMHFEEDASITIAAVLVDHGGLARYAD